MSVPSNATSYAVAVIMQRSALASRWATETWEAKGVIAGGAPAGAQERVLVSDESMTQILFAGYALRLLADEAEGYYLNITSPRPKVFVLWRMRDQIARPEFLTVSYNEGTRWADSGESVDGVAMPAELLPWIGEFVEEHYRPQAPKAKRYASNRDKDRMGGGS